MRFYRDTIDFLNVPHYSCFVLGVEGYFFAFLILIVHKDFWNHPGISKGENYKENFNCNV